MFLDKEYIGTFTKDNFKLEVYKTSETVLSFQLFLKSLSKLNRDSWRLFTEGSTEYCPNSISIEQAAYNCLDSITTIDGYLEV